jgi:hypothetical protein
MSIVSRLAARAALKCDLNVPVSCDQMTREMINKHIALCTFTFVIFQPHYLPHFVLPHQTLHILLETFFIYLKARELFEDAELGGTPRI